MRRPSESRPIPVTDEVTKAPGECQQRRHTRTHSRTQSGPNRIPSAFFACVQSAAPIRPESGHFSDSCAQEKTTIVALGFILETARVYLIQPIEGNEEKWPSVDYFGPADLGYFIWQPILALLCLLQWQLFAFNWPDSVTGRAAWPAT